ncbi:ABC transporter ATP-binding protein [Rhodocytophaga aerolata]|uniref:ABC transporter ATP-binding protein n=1 Tax=Rhodocytophaga aerolata TaxID=455078 RepID=A0ABT8RFW6_9BACT|nr:ABC transporter ATP-binding protein [Rhodocytophaga aerolata]MDO1449607.1 ABC transporter ATP-binding protein [Rhodocytophaga aerolata]
MMEVELQNITKSYGNKTVLKDIHLALPNGSFTCLLGSSGSGKTTILKLLAGFELPDKGDIWISGEKVSSNNKLLKAPHERGIGYIFQDLSLWPHLSVMENIAFGLKIRKVAAYKDKVMEMAQRLNIGETLSKYPHQLSGGQQQLVAIARSLVLEPNLLLMDEPLANLDVKLKKVVREKILELKKLLSINIIYVSHDHREAFTMADQIVVLNEAQVEAVGTPQQIRESPSEFIKYFIEL